MSDKTPFVWDNDLVAEYGMFFHSCFNNPSKYLGKDCLKEFISEKSKEKDIPKEGWQIQVFIAKRFNEPIFLHLAGNGRYNHGTGIDHFSYSLDECLKNKLQIHTVKRLTDKEIFSIGDEIDEMDEGVKHFVQSFWLNHEGNDLWISTNDKKQYGVSFSHAKKVKPKVPLFTTEDGVEIFEGDKYWYVPITSISYTQWGRFQCTSASTGLSLEKYKSFSTEEKAKEYIILNKPIEVSCNDLMRYLTKLYGYHEHTHNDETIKGFFKLKINL